MTTTSSPCWRLRRRERAAIVEIGKAGVGRTDEAPDQPEQHQPQDRITDPLVQAGLVVDEQGIGGKAGDQCPVEQAHGRVPDLVTCHLDNSLPEGDATGRRGRGDLPRQAQSSLTSTTWNLSSM